MSYWLPCYHPDKVEKHHVPLPIFLSRSPRQLYFPHVFFSPHLFHHFFFLFQTFCTFTSLYVCPCVRAHACVCVCTEPLKVGSSNHKPEQSTFSLRWNERNEHFWMKWSRTLHSNPNSFRPFIPPRPVRGAVALRGRNDVRFQTVAAL